MARSRAAVQAPDAPRTVAYSRVSTDMQAEEVRASTFNNASLRPGRRCAA
jgi:hypothetical protein